KRDRSKSRTRYDTEDLPFIQRLPYYRDLAVQSGMFFHEISVELTSLRYSRLNRSLYQLVYTPNDELNFFVLYMDACGLSSYLKFILDVHAFEKLTKLDGANTNNDQKHRTVTKMHKQKQQEGNITSQQQIDALNIFQKYLALDAKYLVPVDDDTRRTTLCRYFELERKNDYIFHFVGLICPATKSPNPETNCFQMAKDFVWKLIEQTSYRSYLSSTYHVRYQLKLLTSSDIRLHDILYNDSSLSYFMEFIEQQHSIDLLRFWLTIEHYYQNTLNPIIDNQTLTENALNIYEQYISLQARNRLGFDDAIRARIECSICQQDVNSGPSADTFDQTAWIVYNILNQEYFSNFLRSDIFCRHISDLMLRLQNDDVVCSTSIKTDSDTTSVNSETPSTNSNSNQQPIPPIEESKQLRQRNVSTSSTQSQENIKWKGKLSMAHIDELGRFVRDSDVESIDCLAKKSYGPLQRLSLFMKNEENEKEMEVNAAKFAENFINSITNLTMNDNGEIFKFQPSVAVTHVRHYQKMYTAHVTSTGGRDGSSKSDDKAGSLNVKLSRPKEMGGNGNGTNPEELFAAGYSGCFLGAMGLAAKNLKKTLPSSTTVSAAVTLGKHNNGNLGLQVELTAKLPGASQADADAIVKEAHTICPYSHATRNNVEVKLNATT
ncbi:unnamed protein product, partial [Didymodactylos carnosus]